MAWIEVTPANYSSVSSGNAAPAEWETDSPVECNGCGEVYDEDENYDSYIRGFDGEYYCNPKTKRLSLCLFKAQQRSVVEALKEQVLPELQRAKATVAEIHQDHDGMLVGDNVDIYQDIEDLIYRIESMNTEVGK